MESQYEAVPSSNMELQIVGFLKEVLSSDDYVVFSDSNEVVVMPRNGDGDYDGSHYWQFGSRPEGCHYWKFGSPPEGGPQTDFVEGFFFSDYERIVFMLDNARHDNPPKESDALTIAKWVVSIVTANIDMKAQS